MSLGPFYPDRLPAPLAFVSDWPSESDLKKQEAFSDLGVFNALLRTGNLRRSDYMITHVYDQRPPQDKLERITWVNENREAQLARLAEELDNAEPACIVPLGDAALGAFIGTFGKMSQFRGSVLPATAVVPGAKLLPTLHPRDVLKQWHLYTIVAGDLIKAAREGLKGPDIVYPERRLLLEPSFNEACEYLGYCSGADLLSVDIETGWGQITCVGVAPNETEAMCIPFVDLRKPNKSYWGSADMEVGVWKALKCLLEDRSVPKLGQNFTYDAFWFLHRMGIKVYNYRHDTRLLHHALYAELPKDLAFLGAAYSQQGAWKSWGQAYSKDKRDD